MTKYFTEDEFRCRCCGQLPESGVDENLQNLLDEIREQLGPLFLTCAYRCDVHNAEVGGVPNSQHNANPCTAADIDASNYGVDTIAQIAESLGADGVGRYYESCFVHIDVRAGRVGDTFRWEE